MRRSRSTLLAIVFAFAALSGLVLLSGCGRNSTKAKLDTQSLENCFASAEPEIKGVISKSVEAVKSSEFKIAFDELEKLIGNQKITPEQLQAVNNLRHELAPLLFQPDAPPKPVAPK